MLDYIRIACAVPAVQVGNVVKNTQDICDYIGKADDRNADIVLFPELALTGYSCQDLLFQDALWDAVGEGVRKIVACSSGHPGVVAVVGLPVRLGANIFNCAAVIGGGKIHGIVPKTFLPNYNEFYEKRWFSSAEALKSNVLDLAIFGMQGKTSMDNTQIFQIGDGTLVGVEICEDLWTPLPPSTMLAMGGAEVLLNLSASDETVGKRSFRRDLIKHQSQNCNCVYAFCSAGPTESVQDVVYSGHCVVAQNGTIALESKKQFTTDDMLLCDCDLGKIRSDRRKNKSFADAAKVYEPFTNPNVVLCDAPSLRADGSLCKLQKLPFVPQSAENRYERGMEVFGIQVAGLQQRLAMLGAKAVVGISGGLDSTLALLVAVQTMKQLGRPATDVYGVTMPCFGTSDRTLENARKLMQGLGISWKEIPIADAVTQHFQDIGHDNNIYDRTYENAQARERTQVLMDYAGMVNGIVVGTGDLSELALGWCTYNGDHMSMYGVNASVPKTLIPCIIEAVAEQEEFVTVKDVLLDIRNTPISPELLPPDEYGMIQQQTESIVGPYVLHDFFLYYMLRYGFTPKKIYALACRAFAGEFDARTIRKWMRSFYSRFFSQQFKRDCTPDCVKVGAVALSPRGDWRMPSDACACLWLNEVDQL